jgi:hypothetical protein
MEDGMNGKLIKNSLFKGLYLILLAFILVFVSCDMIGLGDKVNTGKPSIDNSREGENRAGPFISGTENDVWFEISQDQGFQIIRVYMDVEHYDKSDPRPIFDGVNNGKQTITTRFEGKNDPLGSDKWVITIDTTNMMDGRVTGRITAIDSSGNVTTSTDIIYVVKNDPPQVELTIPFIKDEMFDCEVFMGVENPRPCGCPIEVPHQSPLTTADPLFVGFDLMGLATDDAGIALGWPKIIFWPADDSGIEYDGDGFPIEEPGFEKWSIWRSMEVPQRRDGLTATRVTWPMKNLERSNIPVVRDALNRHGDTVSDYYRLHTGDGGRLPQGNYRFIIWTRDIFGNDFYYPNRTGDVMEWEPETIKYVEIYHMVSEIPIAHFEDAPTHYNGVGAFVVKIKVSSTTLLDNVHLFIADSNTATGNKSPEWLIPISSAEKDDFIYTFNVTFNENFISDWPDPVGSGNLFLFVRATDQNQKSNPSVFHSFTFDTTPPNVKFERPFNIVVPPTPPHFSGTFDSDNTSYEIYRPFASPRWSTGTITVGGWANDPDVSASTGLRIPSSGIREIWYHIGNLGDDAVGITHAQREKIYAEAPWKNTNLNSFQPADGWSGNPNTWSYTESFNNWKEEDKDKPIDQKRYQEASQFGFSETDDLT